MKPIWFVLAWLAFVVGIIGVFLPILPTTPFLILAAYLFSKSSPRFHAWILNLPLAGEGVRDWQEHRRIKPRAKIICTVMILISLGIIWLRPEILLMIKIVVSSILLSVNTYVVSRKSK